MLGMTLERGHLAEAAQVPFGAAGLRGEEGLNEPPGHLGSDGPAAKAQDVHVVILDALARGEMIFDERRANAGDLVRTDRDADAAAAQRDTAFDLATGDGAGEGD